MRGNGARATLALAVMVGAVLAAGLAAPAQADTAPVNGQPATVGADVLPTAQLNGVGWSTAISGNRVFVTGSFSQARPSGAAAGTNQSARANLLSFDLNTGALNSWAPSLNAQGMAIAVSSDGSRVYVGGDFSVASGQTRNRLAAFDATTGALISTFNPSFNGRIRALAVRGNTVYAGGTFTTVAGQARQRLAAIDATSGAVLAWNPGANAEVLGLAASAGTNRVVAGGRFTTLAGGNAYGLGSVDATSGAFQTYGANSVVRNAGSNAGIWSLSTDGNQVYGTGYTFGSGGNFEGTFAANASTGDLNWVAGCLGDTYGAVGLGNAVYTVGHAHNCGMVGGMPEQPTRAWNRAIAFTSYADRTNSSGTFRNRPSASPLYWYPTVDAGSYTGQGQGGWAITGNGQYVVMVGEFPKVNGVNQQGLARFAVSGTAANSQGPQAVSELTPSVSNPSFGRVNLSWRSSWDRDNENLSYDVLRGNTVVSTVTGNSQWWNRPTLSASDTAAPGGSQQYRIRARDAFGNAITSNPVTLNVNGPTAPPPGPGVVATDDFTRTVASGWGSANSGQGWAITGSSVTSTVADGSGRMSVPAGKRGTAVVDIAPIASARVTNTFWLEQAATGGGAIVSTTARSTAAGDYRARIKVNANGSLQATVSRFAAGTDNLLGSTVTLPFTYTAGSKVNVKVEAVGSSPTTIRLKVWPAGSAEPADWLLSVTDSTAGLQVAGKAGVDAYLSGSATAASVVRVDDLQVTSL